MAGTPISDIDLFTALFARLTADTVIGASITTVTLDPAPPDTAPERGQAPRIVYRGGVQFGEVEFGESFTSEGLLWTFQIGIQGHWADGTAALAIVAKRIHGDYDPSSQTAGSYGVHRWTPSVSGWTFQPAMLKQMFTRPIADGLIECVCEFEATGQRV